MVDAASRLECKDCRKLLDTDLFLDHIQKFAGSCKEESTITAPGENSRTVTPFELDESSIPAADRSMLPRKSPDQTAGADISQNYGDEVWIVVCKYICVDLQAKRREGGHGWKAEDCGGDS